MEENWDKYRDKIIGLGDHSLHKSYYPELQEKIEKLEASQHDLQTIMDSIHDAVIIHDIEGKIISLNEYARKLYNINDDKTSQHTFFDITSSLAQDNSNLRNLWNKVLKQQPQVTELIGIQLKTQKKMVLQASLSPTIWNGKEAIVAVIRDFEEQKRYEKELIKAKEKAEQASKLKTEFLQNMSHEIRTPMNGIIGFSDMLSRDDLNSEQHNCYIKIIQNSSLQLLRIIDDILEISTLETKQVKIHEEEFSLNDLFLELFSVFSIKSKEQSIPIYIKKELPDSLSYIITDKNKLSKILNNLIENALKYTNEGYVELGYNIKGNSLLIYVKDTGIGISTKYQQVIFERFSQEVKNATKKYGGLGLGLSISKENALLLGGKIWVESKKGEGSTFYLSIPYKSSEKFLTHTIGKLPTKNTDNSDKRKTILIAEDEVVNYMYFEELFKDEESYILIHAKNGQEAIDICFSNPNIDLVLMDVKMPVLNGYQATKQIKTQIPDLPIIAQTAYSTSEEKKLALKYGFNDFISKPINKDKLFTVLNHYIDKKSSK